MICKGAAKINSGNIFCMVRDLCFAAGKWNKLHDDFISAGILKEKIDNFGRISEQSKQAVFCVALALHDAGISPDENRDDIALVASGQDCCREANRAYFEDYVENGRTLGRGNLFVNTLPTTPAAMAGIACGLHGPLYFCASGNAPYEEAEILLEGKEASGVVLVLEDNAKLAAFVFEKGGSGLQADRKPLIKLFQSFDYKECLTNSN